MSHDSGSAAPGTETDSDTHADTDLDTDTDTADSDKTRPEFSLIVPCYNEEEVIGYTVRRLARAFAAAGIDLEIVACDNGSSDRTGEMLREFEAQGLPLRSHRVEVNQGYGHGVLQSFQHCRAEWIGIIPADGQVDAEDVVRLYDSISKTGGRMIGKVHRRFRLDGAARAFQTFLYNCFINALFLGLGSFDVNGSPKILHRSTVELMQLESKDWLLDAEIVIKARALGLGVLEMNVFARMREHGTSHVGASTCGTFLGRLLGFRFGSRFGAWKRAARARS